MIARLLGWLPSEMQSMSLIREGSKEHERALQSNCMLFTRSCHHTVRYFFRMIEMNSKIFGPVLRYFGRLEFQSMGAAGNKPHIHCGITLQPGCASKEEIIGSVSGECHLTDYNTLLSEGLVRNTADFPDLKGPIHDSDLQSQPRCAVRSRLRLLLMVYPHTQRPICSIFLSLYLLI